MDVDQDVEDYKDANLEDEEISHRWADLEEDEDVHYDAVYDDLTGKMLEGAEVQKARLNEIEALDSMRVWDIVPIAVCLQATGRKPINGRWVDINKGDDDAKVYRSRYVAQEIRKQHGGAQREGLFAPMPPLEALKVVISCAASRPKMDHKLMFIDISKAYLHADVVDQSLFVALPKEMKMSNMCGRLRKALYGTREAAKCWEIEYSKTLEELGFIKGKTNPCLFRHLEHETQVFVHGDDFVVSGTEEHLKIVEDKFRSKYLTKIRGIIGPDPDDLKSIVMLNRVIEWSEIGINMEADQRHVELILKQLEMEDCRGSDIVGSQVTLDENDAKMGSEEVTQFRSLAARCNFLAADRIDMQFACKEVCRRMSGPCIGDWEMLKKMAKYMKAHPRLVVEFRFQEAPDAVQVYVDTDYAGCRRTRRSTNGGMAMLGGHLLKSWSTTQTVVALSSGEAEYYGVAKGACEGIGIAGIIEDLTGIRMKIEMATDSSAAKGIAHRKGVGKVKHLETRTLWVQDQIARGRIKLSKIDGNFNPADLMTKYLSGPRITQLVQLLPLRFKQGRHKLVPQIQS